MRGIVVEGTIEHNQLERLLQVGCDPHPEINVLELAVISSKLNHTFPLNSVKSVNNDINSLQRVFNELINSFHKYNY